MGKLEIISQDQEEVDALGSVYSEAKFDRSRLEGTLSFANKEWLTLLSAQDTASGRIKEGTVGIGRATRKLERLSKGALKRVRNFGEFDCIKIVSFFSYGVYCHNIIDTIPVLMGMDEMEDCELVLVKSEPSVIKMIKGLNIKFKKVKFVSGAKDNYIKARKVILYHHHNAHTRRKEDIIKFKEKIDYETIKLRGEHRKKLIYCTRNVGGGALHGRQIEEKCETRIISILKAHARVNDLDFVLFTGWKDIEKQERLSFLEQMTLFSKAKIVVGPHGGAMVNIIGCLESNDCYIAEFSSGKIPCQGKRSKLFGKNYSKLLSFHPEEIMNYYLIPFSEGSGQSKTLIDLKHLRQFLKYARDSKP